jgi:hypothetical protein
MNSGAGRANEHTEQETIMPHRSAIARATEGLWLVLALACAPRAAVAFPIRAPQIVLQPAPLQNCFNGMGESINVSTDQVPNDSWMPTLTGCDLALTIASLDTTGVSTVGFYSTSQPSPTLCPLLPSGAGAGWTCVCHFAADGSLYAVLLDQTDTFISQTKYAGLDLGHAGLYIQGPGGSWYTEDARNGGRAQVLSFQSTNYPGDVYLGFERSPYDPATSTFASEIVRAQPICGDPARRPTWGQLKARYR